MLMPLPPPPAAALINKGKPIASAAARKASTSPVGVTDGATGTPCALAKLRAEILSPIRSIVSASGPMKTETGVLDRLREARILGEKAVAGMDGVGAGAQRGVDDLAGIEMRDHRRLARYLDSLVGHADVARASLGRVMDRDRAEPDRSQGSQDATGDLATIGDQHLREREGWCARLGVADAVHRRAMSGEVCTGSVSVHSSSKPPGSSHEPGTGSGKSISA